MFDLFGVVLDVLEVDYDFFLWGDVFIKDVVEIWIFYKWENEVDVFCLCFYLYEFCLYYDI